MATFQEWATLPAPDDRSDTTLDMTNYADMHLAFIHMFLGHSNFCYASCINKNLWIPFIYHLLLDETESYKVKSYNL